MKSKLSRAGSAVAGALVCALLLNACGGGGGGDAAKATAQGGQCSLTAQKNNLRQYMRDWYYFNAEAPDPDPAGFDDIISYFKAQLDRPADRWSFVADTASFDAYLDNGQVLSFGLLFDVDDNGQPVVPMVIKSVDPGSPAEQAGLKRGQIVLSINGQSPAGMNPQTFADAMYPATAGQSVSLSVQTSSGVQLLQPVANNYQLSLVSATILRSPNGANAGYLRLDGFVGAETTGPALETALTSLASADSLILDLRYDGGGSLSFASWLVNQIVGMGHDGQAIGLIRYNSKHSDKNQTISFRSSAFVGWKNVYVLTSDATCSASEFVINALKPYVNVVQIGGRTCGKPYGFQSYEDTCSGLSFNAMNVEVFNGRGLGGYSDGIAPTCAVSDDFAHETRDVQERMTSAALSYIDTGSCPVASFGARMQTQGVRSSAEVPGALGKTARRSDMRNNMWLK